MSEISVIVQRLPIGHRCHGNAKGETFNFWRFERLRMSSSDLLQKKDIAATGVIDQDVDCPSPGVQLGLRAGDKVLFTVRTVDGHFLSATTTVASD